MGIFNFLRKDKWIEIYSPITGMVIPLSEVPDEAFAKEMIGDGCAIMPEEGAIYSPVVADIDIFETNHAISLETETGLEMIIHLGIDTVKLGGEGLNRVTEAGHKQIGEKIIEFDLDYIKPRVKSIATPVVITNMDRVSKIEIMKDYGHRIKFGELLMKVKIK